MLFRPQLKRTLLLCLGVACLALGAIGVVLPLLPTAPFLIAAAACFGYADKRWEEKLLNHPHYGGIIRAWRESGTIPLKAKLTATALLVLSATLSWWLLPMTVAWVPSAVGIVVSAWLWTRP